jgi:hypothetical protein
VGQSGRKIKLERETALAFNLTHLNRALLAVALTSAAWVATYAADDNNKLLHLLRASELRVDKLATATIIQNAPGGATVRLISSEGGWALVQLLDTTSKAGPPVNGWVRASSLDWTSGSSAAAGMPSGREVADASALTLGVRSLPARSNRHALIIGIGKYADPAIPPLPGVRLDRESATQIAQSMQVPTENIRYLQNEDATAANIRKAIQDLSDRVQEGDRVFIHYSGHGTRYPDPEAGGCVEALLAYDGVRSGLITNHEMASLLSSITNKTDKLFVMYDACHSGGVVQAASVLRTRGIVVGNEESPLRPKFAAISEECGKPTNVKTRNLVVEVSAKGALPQDIIHLSASRNDEISFDDEQKGGLATQYIRDCILRDAKDLSNSGAITIEDIRVCAQEKIDKRMTGSTQFAPHHLVLNGNANFVPAWFSQDALKPVTISATPSVQVASLTPTPVAVPAASSKPTPAPTPAPAPAPAPVTTSVPAKPASAPAAAVPVAAPVAVAAPVPVAAAPVAATPPPLTGEQALRQMYDQRDAKRKLQVSMSKDKLKIGKDSLEGSIVSERSGYLYIALAGSDNKSIYMLFPNALDQNNKVEAGKPLKLPGDGWSVKAGGPTGTDTLLVMVTDAPRDLSKLGAAKVGPFLASLNDVQGRAQLGALMSTSPLTPTQFCTNPASRTSVCSDAYGAALFTVEEIK